MVRRRVYGDLDYPLYLCIPARRFQFGAAGDEVAASEDAARTQAGRPASTEVTVRGLAADLRISLF